MIIARLPFPTRGFGMHDFSRRNFVKLASALPGALLVGFDPVARSWVAFGQASPDPWAAVPKLDGSLLFDASVREALATDRGQGIHRMPAAVLRPASVHDIVAMVRFANRHDIKIVVRGQGHSQYGQSLAEAGIVVDSSSLNAVRVVNSTTIAAQAGAFWNDVTRTSLAVGLTPPAMGNTMFLPVGGILSAGGISNSSHLHGAVVDTVQSLDVVTGAGDLVTCSPTHNRELFEMVLGGMGQCGLIAEARIRLMPAPAYVARQDFFHDDVGPFLRDMTRLTTEGRVDHLAGYGPVPGGDAARFRTNVGAFGGTRDEAIARLAVGGLDAHAAKAPEVTTYADYLHREDANNAAMAAAMKVTPKRYQYIAMFVPRQAADALVSSIIASPGESAGVARFPIQPLITSKFARPMLKHPADDVIVVLWLFRSISASDADAQAQAAEANLAIIARVTALGGKAYPPYAPYFTRAVWQEHYGPATWRRLVAAKRRFDPRGVLTPGPGVFTSRGGHTT